MDVVLVKPQIPQNTGSIARTCAATRTPLHLVGPLGFEITEKRVKRAGLDYWPWVMLAEHRDWAAYLEVRRPRKVWALSKFGARPYFEAEFDESDAIVFGSETTGLGKDFLAALPPDQVLKIPMECAEVRSLNLSNAVAIVLYEARRQWAEIAARGAHIRRAAT
jgi:tRNA (cytidine/uridine-2'-O-)-methyltransferase